MKAKRVEVTLSSIEDYVRLMNSFFSLTDMEIRVLCEFIKEKLKRENSSNSHNVHLFHHSIKDKISRREFGKSSHYWINGYVKSLKDKGALVPLDEENHYQINRGLVPTGENKIVIDIKWRTDGKE